MHTSLLRLLPLALLLQQLPPLLLLGGSHEAVIGAIHMAACRREEGGEGCREAEGKQNVRIKGKRPGTAQ